MERRRPTTWPWRGSISHSWRECVALISTLFDISPLNDVPSLQLNFADGGVYAGEFQHGMNSGYGVFTFADKVIPVKLELLKLTSSVNACFAAVLAHDR